MDKSTEHFFSERVVGEGCHNNSHFEDHLFDFMPHAPWSKDSIWEGTVHFTKCFVTNASSQMTLTADEVIFDKFFATDDI